MKRLFVAVAMLVSGIAVVLALDLGRYRFEYADAGGHQLRMSITGLGGPVVVFESGGSGRGGGPLEYWERVQSDVSRMTRTVSYDRAGNGWSEKGPNPRDARQIAQELHAALINAQVPAPYLLVGHSFGGPLIRVFAGLYPTEVCGLILIDPTQEEFIAWNEARRPEHRERYDEEWREIQASLAEAHESAVPPGIPVTVITAMGPRVIPDFVAEKDKAEMKEFRPVWLKYHEEWVAKNPGAQHVITLNSAHGVPFEEPELVIKTIVEMVEKIHEHGNGGVRVRP